MIKLFYFPSTGQYTPVFACDVCGERIEQAGQGVTLSPIVPPGTGLTDEENAALSETGDLDEYKVFHVQRQMRG